MWRFKPTTTELVVLGTFSASVGEIAEDLSPVPACDGWLPFRWRLGQELHKRNYLRATRARSEVSVSGEYQSRSGMTLQIVGRIDLLRELKHRLQILEYKTLILPLDASTDTLVPPERFLLQTRIYAYLLDQEQRRHAIKPCKVECSLVLLNLADDRRLTYRVDWNRDAVERLFERYIDLCEHRKALEAVETSRRRMVAESLRWPYSSCRDGQTELIEMATRVLGDGGDLLVNASPGMGKTMALFIPALKTSLERGGQLYFATAKGGGQSPIRNALKILVSQGLLLRALILAPRNSLCLKRESYAGGMGCRWCEYHSLSNPVSLPKILTQPRVVDEGMLRSSGVENRICPVALSRELLKATDLVVGDYNYIFDPKARLEQFAEPYTTNWILLIDEAHNLFDRVRDSYSWELDFPGTIGQLEEIEDDLWRFGDLKTTTQLRSNLSRVRRLLEASLTSFQPMGTNLLDLDAIEWIGDIERFGMSVSRLLAAAYYQPDFDLAEQLLNVYHSLAVFADLLTQDRESHPVYADASRGVGGVICLDPSSVCREMFASFQSVIAFSGTLSPMDFYKSVLGFGERPVSAYDHPTSSTDKRSLITLIPGVDTRLKSRRGSARRIARILLRFVKMHSGGYLAVFPSFEYLNLVASYLADTGIELWLQYPEMAVGERIQLRQALSRKSNTSLAMVVAGGQFTEAEDYAGDACVGIAIIGPCLSPPSIFAELLSQYWTNRGEDGFGVAYIYPGIRRVIQAGGRLLRNEDDRGVILLFDNRFLDEPYFSLLPDNWRSGLLSDCGSWHERVLEFWESMMVE